MNLHNGKEGPVANGVLQSNACKAEIRFKVDNSMSLDWKREFSGFGALVITILLTLGIAVLIHIRGDWGQERVHSISAITVSPSCPC